VGVAAEASAKLWVMAAVIAVKLEKKTDRGYNVSQDTSQMQQNAADL